MQALLVALLFCVGGAAIGALAGALLGNRKKGTIIGGLAGAAFVVYSVVTELQVLRTQEAERERDPWANAMASDPGLREVLKGKRPEEIPGIARRLVADGTPRLDDAALIDRVRLISVLLEKANEHECAGLLAPNGQEQVFALIRLLPPDEQNRGKSLFVRALLAAANNTPRPASPTKEAVSAAFLLAMAQMPAEERRRLAEDMSRGPGPNDAETCWALRTIYRSVLAAPVDARATLARALTTYFSDALNHDARHFTFPFGTASPP